MDIERVRYSLARYFRTRLLKIERSLEYILSNIDIMDRLSMQEKEFATKLNNLNNSYFEDNVSNRFQHNDARDYYETSENRLLNAKPAEKVRFNSIAVVIMALSILTTASFQRGLPFSTLCSVVRVWTLLICSCLRTST